jgi:hypothetical protein
MLNGGHYISYACNPNGNWYCYNDSSCREVLTDAGETTAKVKKSGCTPLRRRKAIRPEQSEKRGDDNAEEANRSQPPSLADDANEDHHGGDDEDDATAAAAADIDVVEKTIESNSYKCAYSDVKVPKIDTSSAYILFYERSGLDYKPYLPEVVSNGQIVPEVELDENESELRKQLCSIQ